MIPNGVPLAETPPRSFREHPASSPSLTAYYQPTAGFKDHRWKEASVWNLSSACVSLLLPCRFPVGSQLRVRLSSKAPAFSMIELVRVIFNNPEPGGSWLHVCVFNQKAGCEEEAES